MRRTITNHQPIYAFGEQIGYLQLIKTDNFEHREIEYKIYKPKHRKQGIMSNYLPVYLAELKRNEIIHLVAHVKKHNHASKKLLKKNGFVKFNQMGNVEVFLIDLSFEHGAGSLEALVNKYVKNFL